VASRLEKRKEIGIKAPFPGFIEPILAEQVDRVPRGDRWILDRESSRVAITEVLVDSRVHPRPKADVPMR
jgi:hypothetical protein